MNWKEFYKNKKVLVTGHTGFKGSWMIAMLSHLGAVVKGYSLDPDNNLSLYHVISGDSLCQSKIGDIRDNNLFKDEVLSFEPDVIVHMAAQALVQRSYADPVETYDVNVTGTANVLNACRSLEKKCAIVIVTTDKVYENLEKEHYYSESDRLGGYDPYSSSKACAEIVVNSFRNSFFNLSEIKNHKKAIASARSGNVIGGGDWSENRIFPDIVRALQSNTSVFVRNPDAVRPWQHVLEPVVAYLKLGSLLYADMEKYSSAYNFGPKKEDHWRVGDVVKKAIECWGSGTYTYGDDKMKHEAGLLMLDITKAKQELDWKPRYSVEEAIRVTMDWYKVSEPEREKFTHKQIEDFLSNEL